MTKLKKCPFCGGPGRVVEWCIMDKAFSPFYICDCDKCGIGTPKMIHRDKAINIWNKRKK